MKYLHEFIDELVRKGIPMLPATEEEIAKVEETVALSKKLPQAYVEFLLHLGRGTKGKFMPGLDWCIDDVINLKEWLEETLIENESKLKLSSDDFVFLSAQGCQYYLFKLTEGNNPPVYMFCESDADTFKKTHDQFSQFLLDEATRYEKYLKKHTSIIKEKNI